MSPRNPITALVLAGLLTACGTPTGRIDQVGTPIDVTTTAPGATAASPTTVVADRRFDITITGDRVTPTAGRRQVQRGETVTISVTSDVAEEVHVHGYDRTFELTPGTPAGATFVADLAGVWEVELHGSGRQIMQLEVR